MNSSHSNNEVEYQALIAGLKWCVDNGVKRLNVYGDALLLMKQINGTWSCKNQILLSLLKKVKGLMRLFKGIQLQHVPRSQNQEADALASKQLTEVTVGAIHLKLPLF